MSQTDCTDLLEGVLNEITKALVTGETVKINNFASFFTKHKKARTGRNVTTGEEVPITPRRVSVFRPSLSLKAKINLFYFAAERHTQGHVTLMSS